MCVFTTAKLNSDWNEQMLVLAKIFFINEISAQAHICLEWLWAIFNYIATQIKHYRDRVFQVELQILPHTNTRRMIDKQEQKFEYTWHEQPV